MNEFPNTLGSAFLRLNLLGLVPSPKLSDWELHDCVLLAQAGDERAIRLLLCSHLNLIRSRVKRWDGYGVDYDDLLAEALLGYYLAVVNDDSRSGTKHTTYAVAAIDRQIQRYVWKFGGTLVRRPFWAERRRDDDKPTDSPLEDWDKDIDESTPETYVLGAEAPGLVASLADRVLRRIDPESRQVLELRYLDDDHDYVPTFEEVARKLGIVRSRAQSLEKKALRQLSAMYGRSKTDIIESLHLWFKRTSPSAGKGKTPDHKIDEAGILRAQGMSWEEIRKLTGVAYHTYKRYRKIA